MSNNVTTTMKMNKAQQIIIDRADTEVKSGFLEYLEFGYRSGRGQLDNLSSEDYGNCVYMIQIGARISEESYIKVGYTKDIQKRFAQHLSSNPLCWLVGFWHMDDCKTWERAFHKRNQSVFGNEWYSADYMDEFEEEIIKASDDMILLD